MRSVNNVASTSSIEFIAVDIKDSMACGVLDTSLIYSQKIYRKERHKTKVMMEIKQNAHHKATVFIFLKCFPK